MTAVTIHAVNPLADSRWDDLIARHPKASIFHQRAWLEALSRTYGYEPVVFTSSPPGNPIKDGLLFCRVKSWLTGNRIVSLPFSDHCEPICDSTSELDSLISGLQTLLHQQHWQYLELRPISEVFSEPCNLQGFQRTGRYFLHVLDLEPDLDALFRSLDKDSVQRRVHRAERGGLVERCGISEKLLKDFYGLLVITRRRHRLPPPPYAWFQNLTDSHGNAMEIRVAYTNDRAIAGILTLRFKQTGYFKYGGSDPQFNKFGATPWLLWNAIVAAKSSGALEFDFGRTEEDNKGLFVFKSHWVKGHKELTYWRYPRALPLDLMGSWKLKVAKGIFSLMPKRVLVASGELVYRHIA
jgi:Acetyltransferase (GNAT) domain